MKWFFILLILFSCNKQEEVTKTKEAVKKIELSDQRVSNSMGEDDFSDLKKKEGDEGCELEENIEEKLVEKKDEAFQLQGATDEDCTVQ